MVGRWLRKRKLRRALEAWARGDVSLPPLPGMQRVEADLRGDAHAALAFYRDVLGDGDWATPWCHAGDGKALVYVTTDGGDSYLEIYEDGALLDSALGHEDRLTWTVRERVREAFERWRSDEGS